MYLTFYILGVNLNDSLSLVDMFFDVMTMRHSPSDHMERSIGSSRSESGWISTSHFDLGHCRHQRQDNQ